MYNTLSGCKILWVGQVDAVESSSARFPPPAALEHGGAVEAGSVVVPFESDLHFAVISLLRFTTDAHKQKKKKARRKLFFFSLPIVRGEGTQVGAVPGIVQRVSGVARVAANLQLVLLSLRVQLETRILGVPFFFFIKKETSIQNK